MKIYFAPMEGITTYTYRNAHAEMFGMCDAYFAPFITPTDNEKISIKNLRDILQENNTTNLKVQVLSNSQTAFVEFAKKISDLGYSEVNLNLGCPSGTVVKKGRGAGFLKDVEKLDRFFDDVFSKTDINISVKTRTGFYSHEEFDELLSVYNKYPITELTIHPRVREDFYKNNPDINVFRKAYHDSMLKLCYNGNIFTMEDYEKITTEFDELSGVMIGRGAIKNPAIFREIKGGEQLKTSELIKFSKVLEERYLKLLGSEVYTLHKLKEIWMYVMMNFPDERKILKAVKKSNRLSDLNMAINCLPEIG